MRSGEEDVGAPAVEEGSREEAEEAEEGEEGEEQQQGGVDIRAKRLEEEIGDDDEEEREWIKRGEADDRRRQEMREKLEQQQQRLALMLSQQQRLQRGEEEGSASEGGEEERGMPSDRARWHVPASPSLAGTGPSDCERESTRRLIEAEYSSPATSTPHSPSTPSSATARAGGAGALDGMVDDCQLTGAEKASGSRWTTEVSHGVVDRWDRGSSGDRDIWRLSAAAMASERLRESDDGWGRAGSVGAGENGDGLQGLEDWGGGTVREWDAGGQLEQLTRAAMATESLRSVDMDTFDLSALEMASSHGGADGSGVNGGEMASGRRWEGFSPRSLSGVRESEEEREYAWGHGEEDAEDARRVLDTGGNNNNADEANPPAPPSPAFGRWTVAGRSGVAGDGNRWAPLEHRLDDVRAHITLADSEREAPADYDGVARSLGGVGRSSPVVLAVLAANPRSSFVRVCECWSLSLS